MFIRITRSARKHRVGATRIRDAMAAAGARVELDGGKLLYIDTDGQGVELEIVAVPLPKGPAMTKKLDPRNYVVTAATKASNIDLTRDEFTLQDGRRLTEDLAEQLASEARAEIGRRNLVPGRKSLSGGGQHSPTIHVRVPEQLHERAEQRAAAEGVSLSSLTREALEAYLAPQGTA